MKCCAEEQVTASPVTPTATLGLGARKRRRQTEHDGTFEGEFDKQLPYHESQDRDIKEGPQVFVRKKKVSETVSSNARREDSPNGDPCALSEPAEAAQLLSPLKGFPDCVIQQQVAEVKGDINAGLTQSLEYNTCVEEVPSSLGTQQTVGTSNRTTVSSTIRQAGLERKARNKRSRSGKSKSVATRTGLAGATSMWHHVRSSQPSVKDKQAELSDKRPAGTEQGVAPSRAEKSKSATIRYKKGQRGIQPSILNYFGKVATTESSLVKEPPPTLALDSETTKDFGRSERVECTELQETEPVQAEPEVIWQFEIQQLMMMLEGGISRGDAKALLCQVGGDIAMAMEIIYNRCGSEENPSVVDKAVPSMESVKDYVEVVPGGHIGDRPEAGLELKMTVVETHPTDMDRKEALIALPSAKYLPVDHGPSAPYLHLARAFDLVERETGRLKTTDMLCNMFRSLLALSGNDVLPAVYLTINRIAPDFEKREMSIGASTVAAAIAEVTGIPRPKLREMYNKMGDLGDVAQAGRQTQTMLRMPPPLTIHQVFSTLKQISVTSGPGSGLCKKNLVLSLLRACREKEIKFIVRTLVQNMRIGAMIKTVLTALAQAVILHRSLPVDQTAEQAMDGLKAQLESAASDLVEAYNVCPNLDVLVPTLLRDGIGGLSNVKICPGTPIKPMLAKITSGVPDVLKRFQGKAFSCEYKYDGQRAQIHLQADGTIQIFSRDCDDCTSRFPDVVNIIRDAVKAETTSFILDTEIVAVDRQNGNKLMAFQHLSTRERGGRGAAVDAKNIKVDVCVFLFDIMYANGAQLVKLPLRERRHWMRDLFAKIKAGYIDFAVEITVEPTESEREDTLSQCLEAFLDEACSASTEGFMAKALDEESEYAASQRSDMWLKVKRDYTEGHDSLDLVPIGAWHGNGRKAGWFSPFLLACHNPEQDTFESVCRVMSGFTDAFYKEMNEFYSSEKVLPRKPPYYHTGEVPDVWFPPEAVWEIRGADLTISPIHHAAFGMVHPSRGVSMRFPRFVSVRTDRRPESATTSSTISYLFEQQARKAPV